AWVRPGAATASPARDAPDSPLRRRPWSSCGACRSECAFRIERSRVDPDRTGEMMKIGSVSNRSVFGSAGGRISASVCLAFALVEAAFAGAVDAAAIPLFPTLFTWNPVNLTSALLSRSEEHTSELQSRENL